jgi:hypothetical protein
VSVFPGFSSHKLVIAMTDGFKQNQLVFDGFSNKISQFVDGFQQNQPVLTVSQQNQLL